MAKLKAEMFKSQKTAAIKLSFRIPMSLAGVIGSDELTNDQKINMVKSFTDEIRDEDGKLMERIPNQHAVILIMALELSAL